MLGDEDGTTPIDASSGDRVRHRLSQAGNRQINRVVHNMATVQPRNPTEGRAYYDRRKADPDWTPVVEGAGFAVTKSRDATVGRRRDKPA